MFIGRLAAQAYRLTAVANFPRECIVMVNIVLTTICITGDTEFDT